MSPMDITHPQVKIDAFGRVYNKLYPRVVRKLCLIGASPTLSEDIAQQTMIDLWVQWETVESPEGIVWKIAHRNLVDAWRKQQRRPEQELGDTDPTRWQDDTEAAYETRSPHDLKLVFEAIRELPPQQRLIMALRSDGWSPAEIAEELQLNPTTVRTNLHYARNKLRRKLTASAAWAGREETWNSTTTTLTSSTAERSSST